MDGKTTQRLEHIGRVLEEIKKTMPSTYGDLDTGFLYDLCQTMIKERDEARERADDILQEWRLCEGEYYDNDDKKFPPLWESNP